MAQEPYSDICNRCSCACGIKKVIYDEDGSINSEFLDLFHERKTRGETFQCYIRKGKACKIMWDALEYYDKEIE